LHLVMSTLLLPVEWGRPDRGSSRLDGIECLQLWYLLRTVESDG
jgi:hypothetical protein